MSESSPRSTKWLTSLRTGIKALVQRHRAWGESQKWLLVSYFSLMNILTIFAGIYAVTWTPVSVFLVVAHPAPHAGSGASESITLSPGLRSALGLTLLFALIVAGMVGGLMRALFRDGMFSNRWAIGALMPAFLALFVWLTHVIRQASVEMPLNNGDNLLVLGYFGAWLLIVGYVAKVPWNEFRDRCATWATEKWPFLVVPAHGDTKPADGVTPSEQPVPSPRSPVDGNVDLRHPER